MNRYLLESAKALRAAQRAYIAFKRQGKMEPDYLEEKQRLGRRVAVAAGELDQAIAEAEAKKEIGEIGGEL